MKREIDRYIREVNKYIERWPGTREIDRLTDIIREIHKNIYSDGQDTKGIDSTVFFFL